MGARALTAWSAAVALTVGLLAGCGGSDSSDATSTPALSAAESTLGASMLPPDAAEASATALGAADLPPDAAATVADDALPPST